MNADGLLAKALKDGTAELVGSNAVHFIAYGSGGPSPTFSVGLRGLGACTVIIVASQHGAIVGYMLPDILSSTDPGSYIKLAEIMMDDIETYYNQHRFYFPDESTRAYIVYSTKNGAPCSPEQLEIASKRLHYSWPVQPLAVKYDSRPPSDITDRGPRGTIWIWTGEGDGAKIYLEDKEISEYPSEPVPRPLSALLFGTRSQSVPALPLHSGPASELGNSAPMVRKSYIWKDGVWTHNVSTAESLATGSAEGS